MSVQEAPSSQKALNFINSSNVTVNFNSALDPGSEPQRKKRRMNDTNVHIDFPAQPLHFDENEDSKPDVTGKVYYVGDTHTYMKDGTEKSEFPVVLISHTKCHQMRVFDEKYREQFPLKKWVKVDNFRQKEDCIFISSRSKIQEVSSNKAPDRRGVIQKAKEIVEEYEPKEIIKIESIKQKLNRRINTKGKITEVFPTETRRYKPGQDIPFRRVTITDNNTEFMEIVLWRDMATRKYQKGQMIEISKAFVKATTDGPCWLSAQSYTVIKDLERDDKLNELPVSESEQMSLIGSIEAVGDVNYYYSCVRCNYKKLDGLKCMKCKLQYNEKTARFGIVCRRLSVKVEDGYRDFKMFTSDVRKFLSFMYPDKDIENIIRSKAVQHELSSGLPCSVSFTDSGKDVMRDMDFITNE